MEFNNRYIKSVNKYFRLKERYMFIGEITALMASFCWTVSSTIVEKKGVGFSAVAMNVARQIAAFLAIGLIIVLFNRSSLSTALSFRGAFFLAMSGLIGFSLGDSFLMSAFTRIGAQITLLIYTISPVLTAILGRIFFGERLSSRNIVGMLIVIGAIMLVIAKGGSSNLKVKGDPKGLIFAFLASVGQALGVLFSKAGLENIPALPATEIRLLGGLVGILVMCSLTKGWPDVKRLFTSRQGIEVTLGNALIGTTIGVVLSMFAIKYTKAAVASTLMTMSPVMIIPIMFFCYKQKVSKYEVLGAVMSVVGVALLV